MTDRTLELCTSRSVRDEARNLLHPFGRRKFLNLVAGAAALPAMTRITRAQAYPTRPVHLIVGFPPGGGADILARLIAQSLSERLGQPFLVDNRPGAGTTIATASVVRAPADGYTLLLIGGSVAITATLYENLNYNFIRDIALVATVARGPNIIVVNPSWPINTVPQLISYAKGNPGGVAIGFGGVGSTPHVAGALFEAMTGVNMSNIPYRGEAQAITDVLGGQIQVCFSTFGGSIEYIKAGKLRALAVTTATRSEMLPGIPAAAEFISGYEASNWWGAGAPKSTPAEIIDRLNKEINAVLVDPNTRARLADLGAMPLSMTLGDFGKYIADETEKWAKVLRASNIKAE